jgi:acyl dehydratase
MGSDSSGMQQMYNDFQLNKTFDLGITSLSEEEIIDFAKQFDPLDFHTNKSAAEKSIFRGIIASGPHIFTLIHRTKWIPLFGHTVICGLQINNWKFLKPLYPDQKIHSTVTINFTEPHPDKNYIIVGWIYEFKDEKEELIQRLEMIVSHKMH